LAHINDDDPGTQWVSDPLLPTGFLKRPDLNAFAAPNVYQVDGSTLPDVGLITDGSLYGLSQVSAQGGRAWFKVAFGASQPMRKLYGRFRSFTDSIFLYAILPGGDSTLLGTVLPGQYAWENWEIPGDMVAGIALYSDDDFQINEIGGLTGALTEEVVIDLGSSQHVCAVRSRHWSTAAAAIVLAVSDDSLTWTTVGHLDPTEHNSQLLPLAEGYQLRYLRFHYELKPLNYKKAYLWEVEALDHTAPYGHMPTAMAATHSLYEMLGINAFWGWGYNRYTDGLLPGEGPEMYTPVASYARDYHNMDWDVVDPDDDISFADMASTGGTPAQWWLNWAREYAAWEAKGLPVQVSIQFGDFPETAWTHPYASAYKYGFSFGRFFGPTYGNGQVHIVEVGNEPWSYDSALYRTILRGMARGLKEADPNLVVLPCALQADDPGAEATSNKHYLGARVTAAEAPYLDGLNIHAYSFFKGGDGIRRAVHPEHMGSKIRSILNVMRWRDQNMPGKQLYVTEWGWDHDGAGQTCEHNECVSEAEAAAYVTRGLLMMQRMGVARATYFYHANLWGMTLFTRSGLTGGKEVNFVKKRSFYALQTLVSEVGNQRLLGVVQENDDAWVYVLGDSLGQATHLVAWRPQAATDTQTYQVTVATEVQPLRAVQVDGRDGDGTPVSLPTQSGGWLTLDVSAFPVLIELVPQHMALKMKPALGGEGHPSGGKEATATAHATGTQSGHGAALSQGLLADDGETEPHLVKVTSERLGLDLEGQVRQRAARPLVWLGPVPTSDVLTVTIDDNINLAAVYRLGMWDFQGRQHYSQVNNIQKKNAIRVDHLAPGAYQFIVFLHDGRQYAQTVIVQR
jgi:serine/threonine-protein kinase ATR